MSKEQRLKAIAQAAKNVKTNIATQKQLDQLAGLIVQSETVEKQQVYSFSELNFND
jgi:ADP-heptose:LPS heptosyltransferase